MQRATGQAPLTSLPLSSEHGLPLADTPESPPPSHPFPWCSLRHRPSFGGFHGTRELLGAACRAGTNTSRAKNADRNSPPTNPRWRDFGVRASGISGFRQKSNYLFDYLLIVLRYLLQSRTGDRGESPLHLRCSLKSHIENLRSAPQGAVQHCAGRYPRYRSSSG